LVERFSEALPLAAASGSIAGELSGVGDDLECVVDDG
jgi:hypothetical protein